MFINRNRRNGSHFLILMRCADDDKLPMRGIVRRTALRQVGNFMMGHVTFTGKTNGEKWTCRVTLSGSYGGDGLTVSVPREVYDKGTDVPPELVEAWDMGGGWNSAGSEAPAMREWGLGLLRKEEESKKRKPRPEPTGKMSADASYRHWCLLRERFRTYMSRSLREEWTADESVDKWKAYFPEGVSPRAQAWVEVSLFAWRDCFREMLYNEFLEWRVWVRGVGHLTREEMRAGEREGKWSWQDTDADKGAHCWKSGKVYSGYDPAKCKHESRTAMPNGMWRCDSCGDEVSEVSHQIRRHDERDTAKGEGQNGVASNA